MLEIEPQLLFVMAIAAYVVFRMVKLLFASRLQKRSVVQYASLLLSYYSYNRELMGAVSTQIDDLTITYFASSGKELVHTNDLERAIRADASSAVMASVHLPFKTSSHLVGVTQHGQADLGLQEFLAQRRLEIIELEGDFPSSFLLYAPPGNQFNARYVFDPKAMAVVVDFCSSHHFEVVGDMLYIVMTSSTAQATSEEQFTNKLIRQFVEEIKPALAVESDEIDLNPAKRAYAATRSKVQCPRCNKILLGEDGVYKCQEGHGVLLSGAQLMKLKKPVAHQKVVSEADLGKQPLVDCPNCGHAMSAVNYQQTGLVIDACLLCGYRWLDSGEDVLLLTP